jgi:hypothetical protein
MNDNFGFKGRIHAVVKDEYGNLKQEQYVENTATVWLDEFVAHYLAVGSSTALGSPGIGFIAIGSGTGQASTSSGLAHGLDINALSGTTVPEKGTGANDNDVIFNGYWAAGDGTGSITEAGVFRGNSYTAGSMLLYSDALSVQKAAGDTLNITWTLTCGAS